MKYIIISVLFCMHLIAMQETYNFDDNGFETEDLTIPIAKKRGLRAKSVASKQKKRRSEIWYKCSECKYKIQSNKQACLQHIRNNHNSIKTARFLAISSDFLMKVCKVPNLGVTYHCTACGTTYDWEQALIKHQKTPTHKKNDALLK